MAYKPTKFILSIKKANWSKKCDLDTTEAAEAAVEALNGKDMREGKTLYVARAQKKAERQQVGLADKDICQYIQKRMIGRFLLHQIK